MHILNFTFARLEFRNACGMPEVFFVCALDRGDRYVKVFGWLVWDSCVRLWWVPVFGGKYVFWVAAVCDVVQLLDIVSVDLRIPFLNVTFGFQPRISLA